MKRALLIAGGTVGGLGAVLSITPPQLGNSGVTGLSGASAATSNSSASATQNSTAINSNSSNNSSAAVTTKTQTTTAKKATTTKKSTATTQKSTTSSNTSSNSANSSSNSNTDNTAAAPAPTPTKAASNGVTGSFTGDAFNVSYGIVQVKITVSNGKITEAVALQAPNGRSQRFSDYAIPNLRQQTLSAQSAAISGVSGASYTSYGWYKSLISALQKAGMNTGV